MQSHFRPLGSRAQRMMGLAVACLAFSTSLLRADEAPVQLQPALEKLESWLTTSDYADGWNQYLKTDLLRAELAKGAGADKKSVAEVLAQYQSNVPALDKPRFVAVRSALQLWLTQLSAISPDQLPQAAGDAHVEFRPPTAEQVQAVKAETRRSARELNRFLSQNPAWSKAWKKYLHWHLLQEQLQSTATDTAQLAQVLKRLSANYEGLENPHFVKLRHTLRRWIDGSLAANKTEVVQKRIQDYSQSLSKGLSSYGTDASHWDAMNIGKQIHFLDRFGVAPQVTTAVRKQHSRPNLAAYVSAGLIAAAMDREIDEPTEIRESILGASIVGTGHTTGRLEVNLIPSDERAVLGLHMSGTTDSQTVAYKRSIRVFADSITELEATKHIHFDAAGFTSRPASAIATTATDVTGLSHRRGNRFIERLAWRKVSQSQGQAQQQSSFKASRRIEERMDQEASKMITKANNKYQAKFRRPLLRKDAFPGLFQVQSNEALIRVKMHQAAADQLAAPRAVTDPPAGHDLAVRLHESFVNNMAANLLGGKTVRSDDAQNEGAEGNFLERFKKQREKKIEERRQIEGRPQKAAPPSDNDEQAPWQMRFASRNPLSVEFRKGTVKFTLRGVQFSGLDDQEYKRAMSMWAVYKVEIDQYGGVRLTLLEQGVDPTSVEKGQRFVAADAPIRSKLRARWKATLEGENGENKVLEVFPLELPDPRLKNVGQLAFRDLDLKDGWLTVAWDRVAEKEEKQAAADVPR